MQQNAGEFDHPSCLSLTIEGNHSLTRKAMDGLNLGNIPLGDHDADWMRVIAGVSNSSIRVKVASICANFVRKHKEEYIIIIEYTARKYGLSFSECFNRLRTGEDLGTPLEHFDVDFEIERKISEIVNGEGL